MKVCTKVNHKEKVFDAIVVAAGKGLRAGGGVPKQFREFLGMPLFMHSVIAFLANEDIRNLVIVYPGDDFDFIQTCLEKYGVKGDAKISLTAGGENRTQSVRNGITALTQSDCSKILIHDAARPGLNNRVIDDLISALRDYEGAAPAISVVDSLKKFDQSKVESVSRDHLYRIQTPQAFQKDSIFNAMDKSSKSANDEFELAEQAGLNLTLTKGSEALSKLTYPEDFERLEKLLSNTEVRLGIGYDVHAFEEGEAVTLCGIEIPHPAKLKGHSDADVAMHALTDAILGALNEGDIGDHFPPSDPQWKGAASHIFLSFAKDRVQQRGGKINNVDLTIICEAPKIKPHREAMRLRLSEILNIDVDRISVKATTTEGLGFEGRREGIATQAAVSISV